ncbi:hypothetical protein, partial [Vibrio parahaemolyticus]|uniref:hypothetical protein n=1 Tax=Vibrio parahaemolyticus TaxID=670 RepID=UPI00116A2E22
VILAQLIHSNSKYKLKIKQIVKSTKNTLAQMGWFVSKKSLVIGTVFNSTRPMYQTDFYNVIGSQNH